MRGRSSSSALPADRHIPRTERGAWQTIRLLLPYLWGYRARIAAALKIGRASCRERV